MLDFVAGFFGIQKMMKKLVVGLSVDVANYGRQAKVPCIDLWTFGSQMHGCIVLCGIF